MPKTSHPWRVCFQALGALHMDPVETASYLLPSHLER